MGDTYSILSQACYYCNTDDSPMMVPTESVEWSKALPPLHPPPPRLYSQKPRQNDWRVPDTNFTLHEAPRCTPLVEYTIDHNNPCDICGENSVPTKIIDCWVVCRNCTTE